MSLPTTNKQKADMLDKYSQSPREKLSKRIKRPDEGWISSQDVNDLPSLPHLYVLMKPHATISGTDPMAVSSRISRYIYSKSSIGKYDNEKMSAVITTTSHLKFSINLYKTCSKDILVEMARISGDTIEYHRLAQDILRVVKGLTPPSNCFERKAVDAKLLSSSIKSVSDLELESTLERILALVTKDRFDAVTLGLESLEVMTNELSSQSNHRMQVSQAILFDGPFQGIKDFVFNRILADKNDNDRDKDEVARELRMILIILTNVLKNCKDDERLINHDTYDLFTGLVRLLKDEEDPHDAYRIAVSIEILLKSSHEFVSLGNELGLPTLVKRCDFGDLLSSVDVVKSIASFFDGVY